MTTTTKETVRQDTLIEDATQPVDGVNRGARVDQIVVGGVKVCNVNMPFLGTRTNHFVAWENVIVLPR